MWISGRRTMLSAAGALLRWSSLEPGRARTGAAGRIADRFPGLGRSLLETRGVDVFAGKAALVAGVILAMAGLGMWLSEDERVRRGLAVAAVAAGAAAGAFVLDRIAGGAISFTSRGPAEIGRSLGAGIWLALAGAMVGLAGGVVGAVFARASSSRRREAADEVPADASPPPTGAAATVPEGSGA
jgi:hypothetical protein